MTKRWCFGSHDARGRGSLRTSALRCTTAHHRQQPSVKQPPLAQRHHVHVNTQRSCHQSTRVGLSALHSATRHTLSSASSRLNCTSLGSFCLTTTSYNRQCQPDESFVTPCQRACQLAPSGTGSTTDRSVFHSHHPSLPSLQPVPERNGLALREWCRE